MNWKNLMRPVAALGLSALVLLGTSAALKPVAQANAEAELESVFSILLPGGAPFIQEVYDGEDAAISAVYKGTDGYVIETVTAGYAGDVTMLVAVDLNGAAVGVLVRDLEETYGLGLEALNDADFLAQLLGSTGDLAVGDNVDAITGATVTSKAVVKAVNSACAYVTGADVSSGATEWGDW